MCYLRDESWFKSFCKKSMEYIDILIQWLDPKIFHQPWIEKHQKICAIVGLTSMQRRHSVQYNCTYAAIFLPIIPTLATSKGNTHHMSKQKYKTGHMIDIIYAGPSII